jgi:hypothetical protein
MTTSKDETMTNSPFGPVRCRAQKSKRCEHGTTRSAAQDEATGSWREDGTYYEPDDSIVCMDCYIALGTPLNPVLEHLSAGPRDDAPTAATLNLILVDEEGNQSRVAKPVDGWQQIGPALGCHYFDVVQLIEGELACYVDDTGRIDNRPINLVASVLYAEHRGATVPLHGPVLFFRPMRDGSDANLGRVGEVAVQAAILAVKLAARSARADRN